MDKPEIIDLDPGRLWYWPGWMASGQADDLYRQLLDEVSWQQDSIRLFGKFHKLPRLQAWYGDPGTSYQYSGLQLSSRPWIYPLQVLRNKLSSQLGYPFNSVLLNHYRNGQDSNGWHADNEPELGCSPVIASISLGAVRRFRLRSNCDRKRTLMLDLEHGSLLLMGAGVQENWQHQLAKTTRPVQGRINLTYRNIIRTVN